MLLMVMICIICLIITLIGVFCLTMFETEYRRKELGIRKAMGATTRHTGAVHSVGIDCNQLSGLDITDKCCSYGVQSTGFAGHNVTIAKTADGQGTETIFVAAGVKRILG